MFSLSVYRWLTFAAHTRDDKWIHLFCLFLPFNYKYFAQIPLKTYQWDLKTFPSIRKYIFQLQLLRELYPIHGGNFPSSSTIFSWVHVILDFMFSFFFISTPSFPLSFVLSSQSSWDPYIYIWLHCKSLLRKKKCSS